MRRKGDLSWEMHAIGIDLGKTVFHVVGVDSSEMVVVRKRCSRTQLLAYTANLQVHRIGMEACSGAHFLGRAVRAHTATENEACQRLTSIPGIGPVTATALVAAIGNGAAFRKGAILGAWVGMVPREYSTGGKQKFSACSTASANAATRIFDDCSSTQGARAVMRCRTRQSPC